MLLHNYFELLVLIMLLSYFHILAIKFLMFFFITLAIFSNILLSIWMMFLVEKVEKTHLILLKTCLLKGDKL